jgi:hypothetical protein
MGTAGAHANGLDEAPVTLEDSVTGLVSKVRRFYFAADVCDL